MRIMNKKILLILVLLLVFQSGCSIISILMTPTTHEKSIEAEYKLSLDQDQKILVLVDQPLWLQADANLRYYITNKVNLALVSKIEVPKASVIGYDKLVEYRSADPAFLMKSDADIGKALGADYVLAVDIQSFDLQQLTTMDYYKGNLIAMSKLVDVRTGQKIWPESIDAKKIHVGIELEIKGRQIVVGKLASAAAHCITRYLYDCKYRQFKIAEDYSYRTEGEWEDVNKWDN